MKKIFLLFLGACALTACNSDDNAIEPQSKKVPMELVADSENRTYLGDNNKVHFLADDQVSVFDGISNNQFELRVRNEDEDAAKRYKQATFFGSTAEVPAENLYVLYPYQSDATFSAGEITATLPATQTLTPLKADADNPDGEASGFDPQANLSVAKVSAEKTFVLNNVGALVKFIVPANQTYTKAIFRGNKDEYVAGKIKISNIDGDTPTYTVVEGSKTVTMEGTFTAGIYYMVVLPQTYSKGFSLTLTNSTTGSEVISGKAATKSVDLASGKVVNMKEMIPSNIYLGHEFVDMGTTVDGKKVYWATMNVGASRVEEPGDYFAWGMTEPCYESYSWSSTTPVGPTFTWKAGDSKGYDWANYTLCEGNYNNLTKYTNNYTKKEKDNKTVLEPEDDAAHVLWGGNWRIPTEEDALKLIEQKTSWTLSASTPDGCFVFKNTNTGGELKFCNTGALVGKAFGGSYPNTACAVNIVSKVNTATCYRFKYLYQTNGTQALTVAGDFNRCVGACIRPVFTLE